MPNKTEWIDENKVKVVKQTEEVIDVSALEAEIAEKQAWIDDYDARKSAMLYEKRAEVEALRAKRDELIAISGRPEPKVEDEVVEQ